jgi:hypothetical protein
MGRGKIFVFIQVVFCNFSIYAQFINLRQPNDSASLVIVVDPHSQVLHLMQNFQIIKSYTISTARAGIGCVLDSYKTPSGKHRIQEKIGAGADYGTIFKSRINTGLIAEIDTSKTGTDHDFITSRILWLSGEEAGHNKGGHLDSYNRYIYIHGTHEEGLIGEPVSLGCIRMCNSDIIELFEIVSVGTTVEILE